ncbi:hypothetical protein [Catenulispora yoronensis]|uniref:sensor histidine kinase n=1 Tax=Catenulispora yoronensis TaxID=450799 RepID=UPI0031D072F1
MSGFGRPAAAGPGADLHRRMDRIVVGVVVLARVTVLGIVVPSVAAGVQQNSYTNVLMASAAYAAVALFGALLIALAVRTVRRPLLPAWVMAADVALLSTAMILLPRAVTPQYLTAAPNPDLEPVMVVVGVTVALVTTSARWTAVACTVLGASYVFGVATRIHTTSGVWSSLSPALWMFSTAGCCAVFIRGLRATADAVETANRQLMAQREQLAADRADEQARRRHFREQVRRHRALHDGPLRILTAIAGPGPLGHHDERARRQCAIAANVLRGTTPDGPHGTLTDLSLALVEAAADSAAAGLRVEYHFAGLPDDLPEAVVGAFASASAEALANVAEHAGVSRARVTALAGSGMPHQDPDATGRPAVTVAIVDQGKGFDDAVTEPGYGIRNSIVAPMREVGGDAAVDSHPGQGTRVDLRWPA